MQRGKNGKGKHEKIQKKDTSEARKFAHNLTYALNPIIKEFDKGIDYTPRRVGSAATNTIVGNASKTFDLDYLFYPKM